MTPSAWSELEGVPDFYWLKTSPRPSVASCQKRGTSFERFQRITRVPNVPFWSSRRDYESNFDEKKNDINKPHVYLRILQKETHKQSTKNVVYVLKND